MDDEKRTTYEAETSQEMMEAKSETGEQTAQAAFSGYEVEFTTLVMIYVGMLCALFMALMESTIVSTSVVTITNDLGGYIKSSWLFTSYMLTYSGFPIIWAKASDIVGRKPCVLASLVIFLASSAACGAAKTLIQLIMFRWLQGIGAAGIFSLTLVFWELLPPSKYALSTSITNTVVSLSFLLGPLLGGAINRNGQWRWVFLINIPVIALATVVLFIYFPRRLSREPVANRTEETLAQRLQRFDVLGGTMLLGVTVPLVTALQQASQGISFGSASIWPLLLAAGFFLIGFLGWQWYTTTRRTLPEPVLPWRFLIHRPSMSIMLSAFFSGCVMTVCVVQIPQRYIVLHSMSPLSAGIRLLPLSLMVPVASALSAVLLDKKILSVNLLLLIGGVLQTSGVALFAVLTSSTDTMARQYGFQVIIGIGLGMVSTATFLLVPTKLEKRDLAVGTGMIAQFRILGGVVALAIVTCVSTPVIRSTLLSSLSQQQTSSILERLAIVRSLPKETQKVVRDSFSRGFDLQMRIITGFAAAHIPAALLIISNDVAPGGLRRKREQGDSNRHNV